MSSTRIADRLAVCTWSLQPKGIEDLVSHLEALDIHAVQLALDPLRENPTAWQNLPDVFSSRGIRIVSGMFGTVGEDYTTIETIQRTGGVLPDATWDENWRNFQQIRDLAKHLGIKLITFHAGFLPEEESDPLYKRVRDRIIRIADLFGSAGIQLGFETGQETAETLKTFLEKLNRPEVGVNFDPANMILYDKGDPVEALRTLKPWLKQCHLKDAIRTRHPGQWGDEVPVGQGEVNWRTFFETLTLVGFQGYCCIEREAGNQRAADIRIAADFVSRL